MFLFKFWSAKITLNFNFDVKYALPQEQPNPYPGPDK